MTFDPLPADDAFWIELAARLGPKSGPILLLERWDRGAGQRSWFMLTAAPDLEAARAGVRPGSSLTVYFHPELPVHGQWSQEVARATSTLIDGLSQHEELVVLIDRGARPLLDVEYLANSDELRRWASEATGKTVWIGRYPDWLPDGDDAITRVLPDADGVVRVHPY